jgi:hypothetical protein
LVLSIAGSKTINNPIIKRLTERAIDRTHSVSPGKNKSIIPKIIFTMLLKSIELLEGFLIILIDNSFIAKLYHYYLYSF